MPYFDVLWSQRKFDKGRFRISHLNVRVYSVYHRFRAPFTKTVLFTPTNSFYGDVVFVF